MLAGCGQASPREEDAGASLCSTLPKLEVQRARLDAKAAWERNDRQLLGVYGSTTEVPGVERTTMPVRMIEGTSDSECHEENQTIRQYAAAYNSEILRRVAGS